MIYTLRTACFDPDNPMYFESLGHTYPTYAEALNAAYRAAINECLNLNQDADDGNYFDLELDPDEYLDENKGFVDIATVWYDKPQNNRYNDLQYRPVTCYQVIEVEDVESYSQAIIAKYGQEKVPRIKTIFERKTGDILYTADYSKVAFNSHRKAIDAYNEAEEYCRKRLTK